MVEEKNINQLNNDFSRCLQKSYKNKLLFKKDT